MQAEKTNKWPRERRRPGKTNRNRCFNQMQKNVTAPGIEQLPLARILARELR
jgi:hypothetical protein